MSFAPRGCGFDPQSSKLASGFQFAWGNEYQLITLWVKHRALDSDSLQFVRQDKMRLSDYNVLRPYNSPFGMIALSAMQARDAAALYSRRHGG